MLPLNEDAQALDLMPYCSRGPAYDYKRKSTNYNACRL